MTYKDYLHYCSNILNIVPLFSFPLASLYQNMTLHHIVLILFLFFFI